MEEEEEVYDEEGPVQESRVDIFYRRRKQNLDQVGFYTIRNRSGEEEKIHLLDRAFLDRITGTLISVDDVENMNPKVMTFALLLIQSICNDEIEEGENKNVLLPKDFPATSISEMLKDARLEEEMSAAFNVSGGRLRNYIRQVFIYSALLWKVLDNPCR